MEFINFISFLGEYNKSLIFAGLIGSISIISMIRVNIKGEYFGKWTTTTYRGFFLFWVSQIIAYSLLLSANSPYFLNTTGNKLWLYGTLIMFVLTLATVFYYCKPFAGKRYGKFLWKLVRCIPWVVIDLLVIDWINFTKGLPKVDALDNKKFLNIFMVIVPIIFSKFDDFIKNEVIKTKTK